MPNTQLLAGCWDCGRSPRLPPHCHPAHTEAQTRATQAQAFHLPGFYLPWGYFLQNTHKALTRYPRLPTHMAALPRPVYSYPPPPPSLNINAQQHFSGNACRGGAHYNARRAQQLRRSTPAPARNSTRAARRRRRYQVLHFLLPQRKPSKTRSSSDALQPAGAMNARQSSTRAAVYAAHFAPRTRTARRPRAWYHFLCCYALT